MSLFSKTEVNKSMLPFIENGEGVGVVKVNGYGKASARMESYKIIFDSYEGKNPIIESVSAITYLSYKKGNFISEPKLEIGISHKKYILSGVDNNDDELETFYRTILDVKNLEKEQKRSSHMGVNKPLLNNEDEFDELESVVDDLNNDMNVDLEKEVLNEISDEPEVVETKTDADVSESEEDLEKIIEDDSGDEFEVLEELDNDEVEVSEESQKNDIPEAESQESDEIDELEDLELFEDSDEIIFEPDEPIVDSPQDIEDDSEFLDEPIVEEYDEDFEDFDDEIVDKEIDSDRIITETDENVESEINEESKEDKTIEAEDEVKKDVVVEQLQETSDSTDNNIITTDNITSEIGKMKQQLFTGINNIQDELNSENQDNPQVSTYMQPDPVDQIRRYYELKEDGIITEEEFELKKKQLLDL